MLIRACTDEDFDSILSIVNDAARAYRGVIPTDRWREPYMPAGELRHEIRAGVTFSGAEAPGGGLLGVMGSQSVHDVILIRHAYVRTGGQRRGTGSALLKHLVERAPRPVLIGTWRAARWAIRFYEKHGFGLVEGTEKDRLLRTYWDIPARQVETSVVMADPRALREIVSRPSDPDRHPDDDGLDMFKLWRTRPPSG